MFKSLTIAILTLCSVAFAETFKMSDFEEGASIGTPFINETTASITVDKTVKLEQIILMYATGFKDVTSITMNFVGSNTLTADYVAFGCLTILTPLAITGDAAAQRFWESQLITSEDYATVTLIETPEMEMELLGHENNIVTLMGATAPGIITLGSSTVEYVGYFFDMESAVNSISVNQVALVGDEDGGKFAIIGKIAPEPATVSLSLMALAGLASRRRRK